MAKIKGMGSVKKALKDLAKHTEVGRKKGVLKTARQIQKDAKAAVPRDTGALANAIVVEQNETTKVIAKKDYAAFQEFGTGSTNVEIPAGYEDYAMEFFETGEGHNKPQPFLFPALFKNENSLIPNVEEAIKEELKKIK